jgi:hypothetical protein
MTATTPCHRHPRGVWTAGCPDCTAWHVEIALARIDAAVSVSVTARPPDHPTPQPLAAGVLPTALHLTA